MPYTLNGRTVTGDFMVADVRYPANVLTLWPREDLEALGLVWVEPSPPAADWSGLARSALSASDVTILRCAERNELVPEAWADYRESLREVMRTGVGPLPDRPPYP